MAEEMEIIKMTDEVVVLEETASKMAVSVDHMETEEGLTLVFQPIISNCSRTEQSSDEEEEYTRPSRGGIQEQDQAPVENVRQDNNESNERYRGRGGRRRGGYRGMF